MTMTATEPALETPITSPEFEEALNRGKTRFENIYISGNLTLAGRGQSKAEGELWITDSVIDGDFNIERLTMRDLNLSRTRITGDLIADHTVFTGLLTLTDLEVGGRIHIIKARMLGDIVCNNLALALRLAFYRTAKIHLREDAIMDYLYDAEG